MSEKIKLTISPVVAQYVRPGTSPEERLAGCAAAAQLTAADRVMLLFCLSKDKELSIRNSALVTMAELPETIIAQYLAQPDPHPLLCIALSQYCRHYPAPQPQSPEPLICAETAAQPDDTSMVDSVCPPEKDDYADMTEDSAVSEEPAEEEVEDEEEFLSKYKTAQMMGIGEKIKMALTGDKEWRSILVKDANKLVSGSVIKNPRITEAEILTLVKSGIQNDEIMRLICANKEWIKNYQIRKALIENNRTPVQSAMRYLGTMGEKDLASFAKSRNISSVISTMAKRLLLNKKK